MNNKELIEVCKPYSFNKAVYFHSSEQYGFGKILRKMAFYPSFLPICAHFEHSSPPFFDEIWDIEKKFLTVAFFHRDDYVAQWNDRFKEKAKGMSFMSPFVWYKKNKKIKISKTAKGSLFFIHHTREGVDRLHDQNRIIKKIEGVDEDQKPVSFCFYYLDIQKGLHLPYQELGYNIVSAGNSNNPNFIENFYNLIINYKYALTNSIGGHLLFATNLGMPVSYFEELEPIHKSELHRFNQAMLTLHTSKTYLDAKKLFKGNNKEVNVKQKEFTDRMLGVFSKTNRFRLSIVLYKSLIQYFFFKINIKYNK
ncbi:hypothetical protein [Polaribacter sp. NJDZ03]|uniref:hypothetical protein n=1 Tax=Polaribacter sp. NJDZ03 TaxID=2855841 RepID=UPI001C4A0688|nr:hypothetical protein [Polaribacter sp. NJDZ03]